MRCRIAKIDKKHFKTCYEFKIWGSKSNRFKNWCKDDYLIFLVAGSICAVSQVSDLPLYSEKSLWESGIYPFRIPISFVKLNECLINDHVKNILKAEWGNHYGWGIRNQQLIEGTNADKLIKHLLNHG